MATKRMFSNVVIDSDRFLDLSQTAQLLYFHLGMKTDDDGFVIGSGRIARLMGASKEVFQELTDSGFLIEFPDSRVFLMTHHRLNNDLKNDRHHDTVYQSEFALIEEKDKVYRLKVDGSMMETDCLQIGNIQETEQSVTQKNVTQKNVSQCSTGEESDERRTLVFDPDIVRNMALSEHVSNEIESIIQEYGAESAYQTMRAWKDDDKRKPVTHYLRKEET